MGPYVVIRQTTPVNYEVKLQVGKQKSDIAHVGSMKPYTQKNLSAEEVIPETDESATQCENRPATSSKTMGELQNQVEPTAVEDENIETIATPIVEPSTATEKTNKIHLSDQQQPEDIPTYRNNRGNITKLPPRIRRRPGHLHFLVPFHFMLLLFTIGPSTSAVLLRDTVIFKEQPGIAMSESSWKLVMDWTPNKEIKTINSVEIILTQLSEAAKRHRADADSFHKKDVRTSFRDTSSYMAAGKIATRVFFFSTLLNMTKNRVSTCTMALSGEKTKRGILDIGGTALKWLFGVSTQSNLMELNTEMGNRGIQH
jgi:hypothetical protein